MVIGILAVLAAVLLPAVQRARAAAAKADCGNRLKQLALALLQHHDGHRSFPPGHRSDVHPDKRRWTGWTTDALPYLEQSAVHAEAVSAFAADPNPFNDPPHAHRKTVIAAFNCPTDRRARTAQVNPEDGKPVGLLGYLGVAGKSTLDETGVLYQDSAVRTADISDGTSGTLLLGERPASHDFRFGWWHSGLGQAGNGSADLVLGTDEPNLLPITSGSACGPGNYPFAPASGLDDPCGLFHFWSPHPGGAHFALADGAVRFVGYDAAGVLAALATRAGNEPAGLD